MSAKIVYTQKGSDPATIMWPSSGPPADRFLLTSGVPFVTDKLIGYGDGSLTYPDGRAFPSLTAQGSTFNHQR